MCFLWQLLRSVPSCKECWPQETRKNTTTDNAVEMPSSSAARPQLALGNKLVTHLQDHRRCCVTEDNPSKICSAQEHAPRHHLIATNDQRNRAATMRVGSKFRRIRRSGSRNCSSIFSWWDGDFAVWHYKPCVADGFGALSNSRNSDLPIPPARHRRAFPCGSVMIVTGAPPTL